MSGRFSRNIRVFIGGIVLLFAAGLVLILLADACLTFFIAPIFDPFPASEKNFPAQPALSEIPDRNYRTCPPAKNITLQGTFRDWSDTSYHNVKLNGSSGDILVLGAGAIVPDVQFTGDSDDLNILWETSYLTDDSPGGGRPAYDYADLPSTASCNIALDNHIGSVIVGNLSGSSLKVKTNRGMLRIDNCSFSEIDGAATTRIGASFYSENASFRSDSGDIALQALGDHGTITARANDGNILLKLPESSGFRINASTRVGRVICDIPVKPDIEKPGQIRGVTDVPSGQSFTIELETQKGDITILYS